MNAFKSRKSKVILGVLIFLSMNILRIFYPILKHRLKSVRKQGYPSVSSGGLFTQEVPESRKDKENKANTA